MYGEQLGRFNFNQKKIFRQKLCNNNKNNSIDIEDIKNPRNFFDNSLWNEII